jgi:hypothetical protein
MMIETNFSTLSLAPQELVSYMLDFSDKLLYLKQKGDCKSFEIIVSNMINTDGSKEFEFDIDTFPNIAELFDLFPYVMFFNRSVEMDGEMFNEFKYSYPLGEMQMGPVDSELLMYFKQDSMDLNKIVMRANSLNITSPLSLSASMPVTPAKFDSQDMSFKNVVCNKATEKEQERLNHYVNRVYELVTKTK